MYLLTGDGRVLQLGLLTVLGSTNPGANLAEYDNMQLTTHPAVGQVP